MSTARVAAVDLGATSVRVATVDLLAPSPRLDLVHRVAHVPVPVAGALRWDWARIMAAVEEGLARALADGPLASIGVDAWGVDYGLLDEDGALVAPPVSYRDARTDGYAAILERLGAERLYARTGVQVMPINTVFQLAVHDRAELEKARRLLLIPELVVHALCGAAVGERSSASTTGLLDVATGAFADDLLAEIGVAPSLLPGVQAAPGELGRWRGVPVTLVGGHDTASAVVALGAPGAAFVSAGSWVLAGVERPAAVLSAEARAANLSNEAGALGGVRLLRNVPGLAVIEALAREHGATAAELLAAAASATPVMVDAAALAAAMAEGPAAGLRAAGGRPDATTPELAAGIVSAIARGVGEVVADVERVTGTSVARLRVGGGGLRAAPLMAALAALGRPVEAVTEEATAFGNALVQGLGLGVFPSLAAARAWLGGAR